MLRQMAGDAGPLLGEAARAIGVSPDTLRRWERAGKLRTAAMPRNRRRVPRREVERLCARPARHRAGDALSARNRFPGVVRSVEVDGVMALVEIEAGPYLSHRRDHARRRRRARARPGVEATATVKATSVMVERGREARSGAPASRRGAPSPRAAATAAASDGQPRWWCPPPPR